METTSGARLRYHTFQIFFFIALLITGSVFISACATKKAYSGPDLPLDKIAIIRPDMDKAFTEIKILSIDEMQMEFYESEVAVWPGNHKLTIEVKMDFPYLDGALAFKQNVSFHVEAGYVYTIYGKIDSVKNEGFLWVMSDKEPDQFVGGAKIGPVKLVTTTY
jgi:hypothetical protein